MLTAHHLSRVDCNQSSQQMSQELASLKDEKERTVERDPKEAHLLEVRELSQRADGGGELGEGATGFKQENKEARAALKERSRGGGQGF